MNDLGRREDLGALRAGVSWALVKAFEARCATDEHLHTAAWFLERHVGFDIGLADFTVARDGRQGPFSDTLSRTVSRLADGGDLLARDEWSRLHLVDRRMRMAGGLADTWLTLRPATAMMAAYLGGRSSGDLGAFVQAVTAIAERAPSNGPRGDIRSLAESVLECSVPLAFVGGPEAVVVRNACEAGGPARGRVLQLFARGMAPGQIVAATHRSSGDITADLIAVFGPLTESYGRQVSLLQRLAPPPSGDHVVPGSPPRPCLHRLDLPSLIAAGRRDPHLTTCRNCTAEAAFARLCVAAVFAPWAWPATAQIPRSAPGSGSGW